MAEPMRWLPLYVDRFLASKRVRRMNAEQVGVYFLLLLEQWDNGPIGDVDDDLELIGRAPVDTVRHVLNACFKMTKKGWRNDVLEDVRSEQHERAERLRRAGQIAGFSSAAARRKRSKDKAPERSLNDRGTTVEQSSTNRREEKRIEENKTPRATRARILPESWNPNDEHRRIALEQHVDLATEATRFRDWATAKGQAYRDWDAAFRNWLRRARSLNGANGNGAHRGQPEPTPARTWNLPAAPEPEPAPPPEERAEVAELAATMKQALRNATVPEPRKRRNPLTREQQLAIARGKKPDGES